MRKLLLIFFFSILSTKESFSEIKKIFCISDDSVRYVDGVKEEIQKSYRKLEIIKETGNTKWCINVGWRGLGESRCSYINNQDKLLYNWYIPFKNFDFSNEPPKNEEEALKKKENYELWLKRKMKENYTIDIKNKKFHYELSSINAYPNFYKGNTFKWVSNGNCEIE